MQGTKKYAVPGVGHTEAVIEEFLRLAPGKYLRSDELQRMTGLSRPGLAKIMPTVRRRVLKAGKSIIGVHGYGYRTVPLARATDLPQSEVLVHVGMSRRLYRPSAKVCFAGRRLVMVLVIHPVIIALLACVAVLLGLAL